MRNSNRPDRRALSTIATVISGISLAVAVPAGAQTAPGESSISYADLADLALDAPLAITAEVRRTSKVDPARTGPVRPGWARACAAAPGRAECA